MLCFNPINCLIRASLKLQDAIIKGLFGYVRAFAVDRGRGSEDEADTCVNQHTADPTFCER